MARIFKTSARFSETAQIFSVEQDASYLKQIFQSLASPHRYHRRDFRKLGKLSELDKKFFIIGNIFESVASPQRYLRRDFQKLGNLSKSGKNFSISETLFRVCQVRRDISGQIFGKWVYFPSQERSFLSPAYFSEFSNSAQICPA